MPRGGKNHVQGGGNPSGGGDFRARRTVYFFPPWPILVVRPCVCRYAIESSVIAYKHRLELLEDELFR